MVSQRVFQIFSYQFLDSSPVTQPPIQMKPGMSCVAHCDICDSWCQAQEQQNTLTTDDSGRKCSVKGRKLQCDQDRAPCGGTLGHLCRCQSKCPPWMMNISRKYDRYGESLSKWTIWCKLYVTHFCYYSFIKSVTCYKRFYDYQQNANPH